MQKSGNLIGLRVLTGSRVFQADLDNSCYRNTASVKSPECRRIDRFCAGRSDLGIEKGQLMKGKLFEHISSYVKLFKQLSSYQSNV